MGTEPGQRFVAGQGGPGPGGPLPGMTEGGKGARLEVSLGAGTRTGLNSETGALRGLTTGTGMCLRGAGTGANSGAGAGTGANSGAGHSGADSGTTSSVADSETALLGADSGTCSGTVLSGAGSGGRSGERTLEGALEEQILDQTTLPGVDLKTTSSIADSGSSWIGADSGGSSTGISDLVAAVRVARISFVDLIRLARDSEKASAAVIMGCLRTASMPVTGRAGCSEMASVAITG